jgi:hypothetical protein
VICVISGIKKKLLQRITRICAESSRIIFFPAVICVISGIKKNFLPQITRICAENSGNKLCDDLRYQRGSIKFAPADYLNLQDLALLEQSRKKRFG